MGGGSSHKRRTQKGRRGGHHGFRKRTPAPSAEPLTHRVLEFEDHTITTGFGFDLMSRFGWTAGEPLGTRSDAASSSDARAEPVPIVVRAGRAGLGARPVVIEGAAAPPPSFLPMPGRSFSSSPASCGADEGEFVSRAATMAVFDPLRPRCRYDQSHVVASLKALHKHEKKCGANPNRAGAKHSSSAEPAEGSVEEWLINSAAHNEETADEDGSVLSDEDSIMSSLSSVLSSSSLSDTVVDI